MKITQRTMKLNHKVYQTIITTASFLMVLQGCLKSDLDELEAHEKKVIEDYLNANNISGDTKTGGGIYYIEHAAGTGITPVKNDYVFINYVGRKLEDNSIVETSDSLLKDEWDDAAYFEGYLFGPSKIKYGSNIPGLIEGLALMKEGGKALMIFPSNKAFYDYIPLSYEIELIKVVKDPIQYEKSTLEAYTLQEGFDETTVMVDTLLWFKETLTPDPGDLVTVAAGDTVYLRFTGRLLDGFYSPVQDDRIFDSNEKVDDPILKAVWQSKTTMKIISGTILGPPPGFIEAVDSMRLGTKAKAVMRFEKAFKEKGVIDDLYEYTIIPPYQSITYDIEVVDIQHPAGR